MLMAQNTEWLTLLLDSLVTATQEPNGYPPEDLQQLLALFTAFARRETAPDRGGEDGEPRVSQVGDAVLRALDEVAAAERNPAASRWDEALSCWEQAAALLAGPAPGVGRPAAALDAAGSLAFWIATTGMVYCVLQLSLDPWADITGHSGEVVLRHLDALEARMIGAWGRDRYQFYTLLKLRYSRWAQYARRHGWVSEADVLTFLVRRTRMGTLAAYLRYGRRSLPAAAGPEPPSDVAAVVSAGTGWQERLGVLGRLSIDGFYYLAAGFGYRPGRLVWINALVVLICGLLYWAFGLLQTGPGAPVTDIVQAEYCSALAFMLAALGEVTPTGTLGQILIVLESTWGFLMISVVIATIVNRNTPAPA